MQIRYVILYIEYSAIKQKKNYLLKFFPYDSFIMTNNLLVFSVVISESIISEPNH